MTARIELASRLDLRASEDLLATLIDARGCDLTLDARRVESLGTQGVQTILAAAKSWAADTKTLTIENVSPDLEAQLAAMGLAADDLTKDSPS